MIPNNDGYSCLGLHYDYRIRVRLYNDIPCIAVSVYKIALIVFRMDLDFWHSDDFLGTYTVTKQTLINDGIVAPYEIEDQPKKTLVWLEQEKYIPRYLEHEARVTFEKASILRPLYIPPRSYMMGLDPWYKMGVDPFRALVQTINFILPWQLAKLGYNALFSDITKSNRLYEAQLPLLLDLSKLTLYQTTENITSPLKAKKVIPLVAQKSISIDASIPFPTDALCTFLGIVNQLSVQDVIRSMSENTKKEQNRFFARCLGYIFPNLGKVAISNAASLPSMFKFLISNSKEGMRGLYRFLVADKTNPKDLQKAGIFGQALLKRMELLDYLNKFYDSEGTLDSAELALSLLQDQSLMEYLNSDTAQTIISDLCSSLEIPGLEGDKVKDLIAIFVNFQRCIINIGDGKLRNWKELTNRAIPHLEEVTQCLNAVLAYAQQLKQIISVFIAPQPYSLEQLLNFHGGQSTKIYPDAKQSFYDCETLFKNFNEDHSLGFLAPIAITTPLKGAINAKQLDDFIFSNILNRESCKHIYAFFDDCAFASFSFKNCQFHNFAFHHVYLKQCDFTNVQFSGQISITNCFMDQKTADDFLKALANSKAQLQEFKNNRIIDGDEIPFDDSLRKLTPVQEVITVDDEDSSSEHATSTQEPEAHAQATSKSYMDSLCDIAKVGIHYSYQLASSGIKQGTGAFINGLTDAAGFSSSKKEEKEKPIERTAHDVHKQNAIEHAELTRLTMEFERFKLYCENEQLKCKNQLLQMEKLSASEIQDLQAKTQNLEKNIQNIEKFFDAINIAKATKEKIAAERKEIFKDPLKKAYYQTLLTNLIAFLHTLALANSKFSLTQTEAGKATAVSSNGSARGSLTGEKEESLLESFKKLLKGGGDISVQMLNLTKIMGQVGEKAVDAMKGAAKHIPEVLTIFGSTGIQALETAAEAIPFAGGVVKFLLDAAIAFNDASKIAETKEVLKGLTPRQIEKIAEEVALKLSKVYEEQILLLSKESDAELFAEYAVGCLAAALFNGHLIDKKANDLPTWTLLATRNLECHQSMTITIGSISVPFPVFTENLAGKGPKTSYKAEKLYRYSGVAVKEGDEKPQYCNLRFEGDESEAYGYIHITKKELKKYFNYHQLRCSSSQSTTDKKPSIKLQASETAPLGDSKPQKLFSPPTVNSSERKDEIEFNDVDVSSARLWEQIERNDKESEHLQNLFAKYQREMKVAQKTMEEIQKRMDKNDEENYLVKRVVIKVRAGEIDKTVLQVPKTPSETILSSEVGQIKPRGLFNVGNSCYINASLQALFNIPSIYDRIITVGQLKIDDDEKFRNALCKIYQNPSYDSLEIFRNFLFSADCLAGGLTSQQDAAEFLNITLRKLVWKPMRIQEAECHNDGTPIRWLGEKSELNPFTENMISIALQSQSCTFQELIDAHFKSLELVEGKETVWYKKPMILNAPEHIFIHLKRFAVRKNAAFILADKLHHRIQFSNQIVRIPCNSTLERFELTDYEIVAYINHEGPTVANGHYYTYLKNRQDGVWYNCNDFKATELGGDFPTELEKEAYLIVLQKR